MKTRSRQSRSAPTTARFQTNQAWGAIRSLLFLAALIGLAVWLSRVSGGTRVTEIVTATALDQSFRPIEPTATFAPDATFFVSIKLEAYQTDKPIIARWKYEGQLINETMLSTEDIGDGYAGFSLSHSDSKWPIGRYTIEILANSQQLGSTSFEVKEAP